MIEERVLFSVHQARLRANGFHASVAFELDAQRFFRGLQRRLPARLRAAACASGSQRSHEALELARPGGLLGIVAHEPVEIVEIDVELSLRRLQGGRNTSLRVTV